MDGYRPTSYGDGFADVYDEWYAEVSPGAATASFVAARCEGPLIELGSGTGRLFGPLVDAGLAVIGLEISTPMLTRSRARHPTIPVAGADMTEPPFRDGAAGGVLIAFNTLFNLPTSTLQRRALARAGDLVAPDGAVVVEAFVPVDEPTDATGHVDVVRQEADLVVLRISRTDPAEGTVSGHHVELRDGEPVRLRPWHLRFTDPAGLDRLAASAGLALAERFADWEETPFDDRSQAHVSVYRPSERRR